MTKAPSQRLFIHATNIHQGGGATLLRALLDVSIDAVCMHMQVQIQVDERMQLIHEPPPHVVVRKVRTSLWHRLLAERWLARKTQDDDLILCFGNLPPLFRTAGRVVVFLQNRYLIGSESLAAFPLRTRLRLQAERLWLRWCAVHADVFVVQTPSMVAALQASGLSDNRQVLVSPFVANANGYQRTKYGVDYANQFAADFTSHLALNASDGPFLYVASGEPHKNHQRLIEAWQLLATQGLFPTLWLTIDIVTFPELWQWIDLHAKSANLSLHNWGKLQYDEVAELYAKAGALIYPSVFESFGLPLIEARQAGLPVIASELDFVRDVLDPEEVFDPNSSHSIARAVKRFLGIHEPPLPLMTAADFINRILNNWK